MRHPRIVTSIGLCAALITAGFFARETWLPWMTPIWSTDPAADEPIHGPGGETQQVHLSAQAQANLHLVVKPLKVDIFWRTIQVPGLIVDRPAQSDRGIVAPITGVVRKVHHFPGDTVKSGEILFTLRLLSEYTQNVQAELFKAVTDVESNREKRARMTKLVQVGTEPTNTMVDLDNQLKRLTASITGYRQDLLTRGFTPEQIQAVTKGAFVQEIEVATPKQRGPDNDLFAGLPMKRPPVRNDGTEPSFELQELKVALGQQVQAGQMLCLLSNHQTLYIEGRAFGQETPLLEKAAKEGWPIQADFLEEGESRWPVLEQTFTIRHIANTIDLASRTFAFYVPLVNQSRSFEKDGRTLMLWRFRPGQRVRLQIPVEKYDNVFVLPADAVVREGPEAYVFRQNGDRFDRKPVRIVYQDRQHVVIANDGSVPAGLFVAQNGATQINRVLRSGGGGLAPGFHMHADGSIHSNAAHK